LRTIHTAPNHNIHHRDQIVAIGDLFAPRYPVFDWLRAVKPTLTAIWTRSRVRHQAVPPRTIPFDADISAMNTARTCASPTSTAQASQDC